VNHFYNHARRLCLEVPAEMLNHFDPGGGVTSETTVQKGSSRCGIIFTDVHDNGHSQTEKGARLGVAVVQQP
jgi:hypothetical protein